LILRKHVFAYPAWKDRVYLLQNQFKNSST
jgi:hypothetical protein